MALDQNKIDAARLSLWVATRNVEFFDMMVGEIQSIRILVESGHEQIEKLKSRVLDLEIDKINARSLKG